MLDTTLFRAEACVVVGCVVALALRGGARALERRQPGLSIGRPLMVGFAVRIGAIGIAAVFPAFAIKLRTSDEAAFLASAKQLAALPFTNHGWPSLTVHWTHVVPWSLTIKLLGQVGEVPLRIEQIGIELGAIALVAWAAAMLGSARSGVIAAWILALEPTNAFFGTALHRESLFLLGEALVLVALTRMWLRGPSRGALIAAGAGVLLTYGTRSYMAFFIGIAIAAVLLSIVVRRRLGARTAVMVMIALTVVLGAAGMAAAPHVVPGQLARVQAVLDYPYPGFNNLQLPHSNVTTSSGLAHTVVARSFDLVTRPFPWQLGSLAQRAAVVGTLLWYLLIVGLVVLAFIAGSRVYIRATPVVLLALTETVGFSLSLNNAGLGFRHRVSLVVLLAAAAGLLIDGVASRRSQAPAIQGALVGEGQPENLA